MIEVDEFETKSISARPHLEYCIQAWSPYYQADKDKLEQVQSRAVNMVAGLKGRSYEQKLSEVGLTTLEKRRTRGDMIQTFRIVNGKDHVDPHTWFTMADERDRLGAASTRHSRDSTRMVEGGSKTELRRNFFSQRVPSMWSSLPVSTRNKNSVVAFKAAFDGTLLMQPG